MESEGRKLHGEAEQAREKGDFEKALILTDQATIAYQKERDDLGLSEVQASRFITFKHLFQNTGYKSYEVLMRIAAETSVEIARLSKIPEALALPLFNLGKAYQEMHMYKEAVPILEEAVTEITTHPSEMHNRPAVVADIKGHLYYCQYKSGNKSALEETEQALTEIEASDEEKYNKDVWLSGARMRIADMLREDNPEKAKEHLQKAKDIIDANPDLKLRAKQWEKLAATFN